MRTDRLDPVNSLFFAIWRQRLKMDVYWQKPAVTSYIRRRRRNSTNRFDWIFVCFPDARQDFFFFWGGGGGEADAVTIHTSYLILKNYVIKSRQYNYNYKASLFAAAFIYT